MQLQKINDPIMHNALAAGVELESFARIVMEEWLTKVEYGFQDGGCLMLASAIRSWSKGEAELHAVLHPIRAGQAQHVYASLGGALCLDSDGIGSPADMIAKVEHYGRMTGSYVGPYSAAEDDVIPSDPDLIEWLACQLQDFIGDFAAFHERIYRDPQLPGNLTRLADEPAA